MFPRPGTPLTVSVVAPPDGSSVWVRLAGDVDMAAEPALAEALDRLDGIGLRLVIIDLAAVTFVCSTFAHFLDALRRAQPHAALLLNHASAMVRLVVRVAGLDSFVVMTDGPLPPATPPADHVRHLPPAGVAHTG